MDIPPDWRALADRLERQEWRRLIVLGDADSGKSSLCRYLGEQLPELSLLDSDPGQKMVGPPSCVTLGDWSGGGLQLRRMSFIGDLHPVGQAAAIVAAVARLSSTPGVRRLVVNTTGLIVGPGVPLKRAKIDALDPDLVIAIQREAELEPLVAALPQDRVHRLAPSGAARRKSMGQRRSSREAGLVAALSGLRQLVLPNAAAEELLRSPPPADALRLCCTAGEDREDRALGLVRLEQFERNRLAWVAGDPADIRRIRLGIAVPREVGRAALAQSRPAAD